MMMKMFWDKIRHTIEVYIDDMVVKSVQLRCTIDDMVVKSKWEAQHIEDVKGVFEVLWQYRLRLNAKKCAFGVGASKFLGYLITNQGIEANPD